jgi:hypothetical protein
MPKPLKMLLGMVLLLLCVGLAPEMLSPAEAFAQTVDTACVRTYTGLGISGYGAYAIAVDSSGNVYVTGVGYGIGAHRDYATIKYYPDRDTAWVRRYNGPANNGDGAYAIAGDDSGNVYVTGWSYGSGTSCDYATIKYMPNGDTAWVRRYNGPGNLYDCANTIAVDGSHNVYVAGTSDGSGTNWDYATIKYKPNGDTAWVRRYNGPGGDGIDEAYDIVVDDSGNVYVTGECHGTEPPPFYSDGWGGGKRRLTMTMPPLSIKSTEIPCG